MSQILNELTLNDYNEPVLSNDSPELVAAKALQNAAREFDPRDFPGGIKVGDRYDATMPFVRRVRVDLIGRDRIRVTAWRDCCTVAFKSISEGREQDVAVPCRDAWQEVWGVEQITELRLNKAEGCMVGHPRKAVVVLKENRPAMLAAGSRMVPVMDEETRAKFEAGQFAPNWQIVKVVPYTGDDQPVMPAAKKVAPVAEKTAIPGLRMASQGDSPVVAKRPPFSP